MQENAWGVSPFSLNLLKKFEGYTAKPKWDHKQYSVGYSTRWNPGQPIGTREDHERALADEAGKVDAHISNRVKVPLTPEQRSALTSFGFNLGPGAIDRILPDINASNWDRVGQRMLTFSRAGNNPNALVDRRRQEVALLTGQAPSDANMNRNPNVDPRNPHSAAFQQQMMGGTGAPTGGPMPMAIPSAPTGRYSKLADALMARAASAQPKGWGDALNALGSAYLGYSLADKNDTAEKAYRSKLSEALMGAKDNDALVNTMLSSGDPDLQNSAVSLKVAQMKPTKPEIGRFKVENGVVVDSTTGQIVAGELGKTAGEKPPMGYRRTTEGNLEFIPGGPADPAVKPKGRDKYTEGQSKSANFGQMMTEAEALIGDQASPIGFWGGLRESLAPEAINNQMRTPEYQKYKQAADQWIRAKLRKESGATITPEESEGEFRTFFPQPGDAPEVVEQKKLARQQAIQGMIAESGGAYGQLMGTPAAPTEAAAPAPEGQPAQISTQEEYQALPPGTQYLAPDGSLRTKQ